MTRYQDILLWLDTWPWPMMFIIMVNEFRMGWNWNQMEDQIGAVLHWSHQKEPEQAKGKAEVIKRNLNRIHISAATPLPSNPSKHSQVSEPPSNNFLFPATKWGELRNAAVRLSVCPSVRLSFRPSHTCEHDISKTQRISTKLGGGVRYGPRIMPLNFGLGPPRPKKKNC